MSWPDRLIAEIASRQFGLITRAQLIALGISRRTIDYSLARGRLTPVHRGVYAVGHLALPALAAEFAAVLAVGERALVSHHSALALWGLTPRREGDIELTLVGRDAGRTRRGIRIHQALTLDARDATTRKRIPVTSPARTLLDVAPRQSLRELEIMVADGLKRRLFTRHAVATMLDRTPGRPGAHRLAALAEAERRLPTLTRSEAEERFLELVRRAGLPTPEVNVRLGRFTVDFLWRAERLVVEVDGYEFHSTRRSFEDDHARDLELSTAGFAVIRFTWRQLVEQPELVLVRLTQRLTELRRQSGR
jgi:very-short-patch-repair endonuclease